MSVFDSKWLAKKMVEIVNLPSNPRSVIASGIDVEKSRRYTIEVQERVGLKERVSGDKVREGDLR